MPASSDPLTLVFAPPTKSSRTTAIIRDAVNAGKPLPLAVMLESMWRWRDEAIRLEFSDPPLSRQYRKAAVDVAVQAAPYVHPRQANITLRPEDELEAQERRVLTRSIAEQVEGKSVKELGRLWLSVARGERQESVESPATVDGTEGSDVGHREPPERQENSSESEGGR